MVRNLRPSPRATALPIDARLRAERLAPDGSQGSFMAALDGLPDGNFVTFADGPERAYRVWGGNLFAWTAGS